MNDCDTKYVRFDKWVLYCGKLSDNDEETGISEDESDDRASRREWKPHTADSQNRIQNCFRRGIHGLPDDYGWTGGW